MAMGDQTDFVAYEFRATEAWKRRDYELAVSAAAAGASEALSAGSSEGAARLLLLQAQVEFDTGQYDHVLEAVEALLALGVDDASLRMQAQKYKALVLQTTGHMEEAVAVARESIAEAYRDPVGRRQSMDLHWVLIAVLAESGRLAEAWDASLELADLAEGSVDQQAAGKSYWAVGNTAFLTGRIEEAEHFHRLAAENLSRHRDVNGWALFNKASANMRLHSGLVNEKTLDCIVRAELAISVTGGNARDQLEVALLRAHWDILSGAPKESLKRLDELQLAKRDVPDLVTAEWWYLRALATEYLGDSQDAALMAANAVEIYRNNGAEIQLMRAQELLDRSSGVES
ncbi:hypothetical protein BN1051_00853 [Arthrobacter saudimassiliensis]|uniref:Tetratricopeptide repeat n=1 Tax=Arthrobacter saudimassiliensis TaxID=1461584 RepID=A0A078MJJ9_9MICC|nr:hypothetical protein BN1051_00853 [Arthrobacter saudimassiliensis]